MCESEEPSERDAVKEAVDGKVHKRTATCSAVDQPISKPWVAGQATPFVSENLVPLRAVFSIQRNRRTRAGPGCATALLGRANMG